MPVKILVVDDEPDLKLLIQQKFRRQIRDGRFDFLFAHNGVEALAQLEANPNVDLVLSDINMPEIDGLTLLTKLPQSSNQLKTVMVSAYGDLQNIRRKCGHDLCLHVRRRHHVTAPLGLLFDTPPQVDLAGRFCTQSDRLGRFAVEPAVDHLGRRRSAKRHFPIAERLRVLRGSARALASSVARILIVVVLPAPFGPMKPRT